MDIVYKQCALGCHVLPWHVKNFDSGYDITDPKVEQIPSSQPAEACYYNLPFLQITLINECQKYIYHIFCSHSRKTVATTRVGQAHQTFGCPGP